MFWLLCLTPSGFVVVMRWVMTFDGFGCNLAVLCGTLFFRSSVSNSYDSMLSEYSSTLL